MPQALPLASVSVKWVSEKSSLGLESLSFIPGGPGILAANLPEPCLFN